MQRLTYVYDPMCSWCFGFSATYRAILADLPPSVVSARLLGGLAPDSDVPMDASMAAMLSSTWHRIEESCGVRFNHDYWQQSPLPPRTTFIACRAIIAAQALGVADLDMLAAIQRAYYQQARNVWQAEVLTELAVELGVPANDFVAELGHVRTLAQHTEQQNRAASMGVQGYPTLIWQDDQQSGRLPIDYGKPEVTLEVIRSLLAAADVE
ncbi:MAG: DsbA family protein [Litorivicinus sp.]